MLDEENNSNQFRLFAKGILVFAISLGIWFACPRPLIKPVVVRYPPLPRLVGNLEVNTRLTAASRIYTSQIIGPECVVVIKDALYTGTLDGNVVKIDENGPKVFAKFGSKSCSDISSCGRPLGLHFDEPRNRLLVVDAYLGVFAINMETEEAFKIFPGPTSPPINVTFFNALDVLSDGRFVLTETSQKFPLHQLMYDLLEGRPTGRVLIVDPETGDWNVLADNLYFANGIQVHRNGTAVIVAETGMARVIRIPLDGDSQMREVFADNLPGLPDNVNRSPRGGYWISMATTRSSESPSLLDRLANWPSVRMVLYLLLPHKWMLYFATLRQHALIIRVDEAGRILESLHDTSGKLSNVADVYEHDGTLLLGSYRANFIGRLTL